MILSVQIPVGAHLKVKVGDRLDFDTPFFEIPSNTEYVVSFSQKLGVEPSKIFHFLKKFVGEDVKKGDILAVKRSMLSTKTIASEYDGRIKEIDHIGGTIVITAEGKKNVMNSLVKGEVSDIKNKTVSVKVKETKEFALKKNSVDFGGPVFYMKHATDSVSSSDVANKILVAEAITYYIQSKIEALGIGGYCTLMKLPEEAVLPYAQIKTIEDLKTIMKLEYPYCFINATSGTIVLYTT